MLLDYHFTTSYPDYKFADTILFRQTPPSKVGELSKEPRNFDADRMLLFDEKNAFDMVIREGIFPMYSNSYLVMTGLRRTPFIRNSLNDRADIYAIRTDIVEQEKGVSSAKYRIPGSGRACGKYSEIFIRN